MYALLLSNIFFTAKSDIFTQLLVDQRFLDEYIMLFTSQIHVAEHIHNTQTQTIAITRQG